MSTVEVLVEEGYFFIREIEGRGLCGIRRMIYTVGLFVGLTEDYYEGRYCYQNMADAMLAIQEWDGVDDAP